jgi:hypothetical protein
VLTSDADISWTADVERRLFAIRRRNRPGEVLLIGVDRALGNFETNAGDQPETELLFNSRERFATINKIAEGAEDPS